MTKIKTLLCITLLLLGLTACMPDTTADVYDNDSKIASDSNTYSITNDEQTIENQTYQGSTERFEGMDTIWTYEATEDENVELTCLITVYSGKLKLVLIAPDDSLTTLAEITPETNRNEFQTYLMNLKKGKNRIKVVGEKNTKFDIELSIPVGDFMELGF